MLWLHQSAAVGFRYENYIPVMGGVKMRVVDILNEIRKDFMRLRHLGNSCAAASAMCEIVYDGRVPTALTEQR